MALPLRNDGELGIELPVDPIMSGLVHLLLPLIVCELRSLLRNAPPST